MNPATTTSTKTRPKSPPAAFERSPNDALLPATFALPPPLAMHPALMQRVPIRESVASASPIPSTGSSRIISSPLTPPDNGVMGMKLDGLASSGDEWRQVLANARASFDNERQVWEQERLLYQRDIAALRQLLGAKDQELVIATTKLKQAELAIAQPDSFHRHIASPPNQPSVGQSLGVTPVMSPPSGHRVTGDVSRPENVSPQRLDDHTPTSNGAQIANMQHPNLATFTVTHHGGGDSDDEVTRRAPLPVRGREHSADDPPSPVSTAANLSPPPESYRRHAGHTPGKVGSLTFSEAASPLGEKTPRQSHYPPDQPEDQSDGSIDEDKELTGPLFLPSHPDQSQDTDMLSTLSAKLESISDNPDEQTPACLQGMSSMSSEVSDASEDANEADEADESPSALPNLDEDNDEGSPAPMPGIRLKTKSSFNFGAPLGQMTRYRAKDDFEDF